MNWEQSYCCSTEGSVLEQKTESVPAPQVLLSACTLLKRQSLLPLQTRESILYEDTERRKLSANTTLEDGDTTHSCKQYETVPHRARGGNGSKLLQKTSKTFIFFVEFNWQVTVWLYCTLTAKTACSKDYISNTKLGMQLQNFCDPLICGLFSRIIDQLFSWENVSVSQIPRGRPHNHNPKIFSLLSGVKNPENLHCKTSSKTNELII